MARLGEYDLISSNDGANPIDMIIDKKIVHENYVSNVVLNDIALLRLQGVAPVTGTYILFTTTHFIHKLNNF